MLAAAAAPLSGTPWLAVHHDLLPSAGVAAAVRAASRRADGVVATSHAVARDLRGGARDDPAPGRRPRRLAACCRAPEGPPRALVLGALVPWKRADLALEIAARIPDLRLELAGATLPGDRDGFEVGLRVRAALRDLAGRVTFSGALPDPRVGARPLARAAALRGRRAVRDGAAGGARDAAARSPRRPPPGRSRSSKTAPGGSTRRATPDAGAEAVRALLDDAAAPAAARARAERFPVEASAARLAAAVEAIAR